MSTHPLRSVSVLSALALSLLSGCILVIDKGGGPGPGPYPPVETGWVDDTGGVACTDMAAASVLVHVVDPSGAPVPDAAVMWGRPDGEAMTPAECADDACTSWIAGWEIGGDIAVTASYHADTPDPCCWYDDSASQVVSVPYTADGCHVVTQDLTLVLDRGSMVCADADPATGQCG